MNAGNTVFSQLMSLIPNYELRKDGRGLTPAITVFCHHIRCFTY
ncbi:DUF4372 domain-containing protein [Prevotella communis]|nr:DUF4372 domain-containing protein [Prevotella communis]UKK62762.1 DUF4372 domain-containing protein [Prevotella communis]UKK65588.1 DUF4372 domain-containing protein [Prevotella communis]